MVEILILFFFFFEVSCRWCSSRIPLAYSHSEISFVRRNEGVNGDIRYSDIVAKTRVNFVSNSISFVPVRVIRVIICGSFL